MNQLITSFRTGNQSGSRPSLTHLLLHLGPCDQVSLVPKCVPFSSGFSSLLPLLPPLEGLSFVPTFYCFQQESLDKWEEQWKMGKKTTDTQIKKLVPQQHKE